MQPLTLEHLLSVLSPFANHGDNLSPQDASLIQLYITELLTDYYVDLPILKFLSRFLTPQAYEEIIEERNIEHLCGYITCNNTPKQQVRRRSSNNGRPGDDIMQPITKYQIYNRKPSIILPNTYLSQYCCKEHYQSSIFYRNQISSEALFARKDILTIPPFPSSRPSTWYENGITCLEEVLAKHRELKDQGKSLKDIVSMMSGLNVDDTDGATKDTSELIQLLNDFEIVEKEGGINGDDYDKDEKSGEVIEDDETSAQDKSRGIDGYITTDKYFGGYVV